MPTSGLVLSALSFRSSFSGPSSRCNSQYRLYQWGRANSIRIRITIHTTAAFGRRTSSRTTTHKIKKELSICQSSLCLSCPDLGIIRESTPASKIKAPGVATASQLRLWREDLHDYYQVTKGSTCLRKLYELVRGIHSRRDKGGKGDFKTLPSSGEDPLVNLIDGLVPASLVVHNHETVGRGRGAASTWAAASRNTTRNYCEQEKEQQSSSSERSGIHITLSLNRMEVYTKAEHSGDAVQPW
ncbi:hypothetical protein MAPG_10461 [Magnaporthiopsis poae ATCC 64411]|uniref:Uncharacterized protein n=1 Tax=Magnaporthiopsis poae (strain ATCC 64411 / 73-15) TaxID=644358 RepID=A0A0C4ECN0_MAGP6|nr:hypothetical protein MAPG_10461 [Magnaporthiopsis poae ATCC 64411]